MATPFVTSERGGRPRAAAPANTKPPPGPAEPRPGGGAVHAAARHGPWHVGADDPGGVREGGATAARPATAGAGGVDLVAVVLVVRDPVDVVEGLVILAEGVIVVVP